MKTFREIRVLALLLAMGALVYALIRPFGLALRRVSRHPVFRPALAVVAIFLLALLDRHLALAAPIAIGALSEGRHTGEFVLSEAEGTGSRDTVTVTIPASTTWSAGSVLGIISASGKYVEYDDTASDGRESAAAILYDNVTNDDSAPADLSAVVIDWSAEVRGADLVYITGADTAKAEADLRGVGVKVRG